MGSQKSHLTSKKNKSKKGNQIPEGEEEIKGEGAIHEIGHEFTSQTIFPNIDIFDGITIVDMPGSGDNRNWAKMQNFYSMKEVMSRIKNIYFVLVIPEQEF